MFTRKHTGVIILLVMLMLVPFWLPNLKLVIGELYTFANTVSEQVVGETYAQRPQTQSQQGIDLELDSQSQNVQYNYDGSYSDERGNKLVVEGDQDSVLIKVKLTGDLYDKLQQDAEQFIRSIRMNLQVRN